MVKISDVCIPHLVMLPLAISAYAWYNGQKEAGLFTAIWVPSILGFGIYFKLLFAQGKAHE